MRAMTPSYQGQKTRVTITACDPAQRLIHGRFKDGGSTSIAVFEIPASFRWPQVKEVWTVSKQNGYWILGSRVNSDQAETFPVTALSTDPDLRLDGTTIYDLNGNQVIAVMMSGVQNLDFPVYSTTTSGWGLNNITTLSGVTFSSNPVGPAGGVLSGSYPNPSLATTAVKGLSDLIAIGKSANYTAVNGDWVITQTTGITIQAPTLAANAVFAVSNYGGTAALPTAVFAATGTFLGTGLGGNTTLYLGAASATIIFQCDGSNWWCIGGEQDTGWLTVSNGSMSNSWANGSPAFGYRLQGNTVRLRGCLTAGNSGATALTLPAGFRPAVGLDASAVYTGSNNVAFIALSTGGVLVPEVSGVSNVGSQAFVMDSITFTVD